MQTSQHLAIPFNINTDCTSGKKTTKEKYQFRNSFKTVASFVYVYTMCSEKLTQIFKIKF